MTNKFKRWEFKCWDDWSNGWLKTLLLITTEIIIVYIFSNLPFIFAALQSDIPHSTTNPAIFNEFIGVLRSEIQKGELLTFICALLAPVVYFCLIEFKKALMVKLLSFPTLLILVFAAFLHGSDSEFTFFSSFDLYIGALAVWISAVLISRIPPDKPSYREVIDRQEEDFINATRHG